MNIGSLDLKIKNKIESTSLVCVDLNRVKEGRLVFQLVKD